MLKLINISNDNLMNNSGNWRNHMQRPSQATNLDSTIVQVCDDVRDSGDDAVIRYSKQWDNVSWDSSSDYKISVANYLKNNKPNNKLKKAIDCALEQLNAYHQPQLPSDYNLAMGNIKMGRKWQPLNRVGLYIPGGQAPLISTAMMLMVPANIAGVKEMIIATPPSINFNQALQPIIHPGIAYIADIFNVEYIFNIGGAQAIAAMAYGTETIPKVQKIFGPGNKFVDAAKRYLNLNVSDVGIDLPAGPSEVMVVADLKANPDWVAMDLLSQAEHDSDAQVILLVDDESFANRVNESLKATLLKMPSVKSQKVAAESLGNGCVFVLEKGALSSSVGREQAISMIADYAPEHLILQVEEAAKWLPKLNNVGSVFLGYQTPESLGDYASGTNHVLPTGGSAAYASGLGVLDFMRATSWQENNDSRKNNPVLEAVVTLAKEEGLWAHEQAMAMRMQDINCKKTEVIS